MNFHESHEVNEVSDHELWLMLAEMRRIAEEAHQLGEEITARCRAALDELEADEEGHGPHRLS